ncbi:MAG: 30S ribosomal protein S6, partial [Dehalococcoidia bacterium]
MRDYEIVTIFTPDTADDAVPGTTEKIHQLILNKEGSVGKVQRWGRRRLSYPIDHHTEGHYVVTRFSLEPQLISELDAELRVSEDVIRHLIVRVDSEGLDTDADSIEGPMESQPQEVKQEEKQGEAEIEEKQEDEAEPEEAQLEE